MDDLHQIVLPRHDLCDVLVGARRFVDHARILAAFDAARLLAQVLDGERPARGRAAHATPGAVRRRFE
jgi:hypothetical protein